MSRFLDFSPFISRRNAHKGDDFMRKKIAEKTGVLEVFYWEIWQKKEMEVGWWICYNLLKLFKIW